MCVYTYIHTHTHLFYWLVGFEVQQETNTELQSIKEKNRRPSSFQMVILSDRSTLNLSFAIQNSYLKFAVLSLYLLLWYNCILNSLAQFSGAFRLPQNKSGESLFLMPIFQAFKFGLGCGFFCLWSLHFICNNCTFIFLYPLTPEFSFSPPSPHSYIHSWTIVSEKAPWWKDQDRNSDHSSVFSLE